jgi:hypothetical protein
MTFADDMLASVLDTILALGTTCTVSEVAGVYSTDGTVTETVTDHDDVPCSDLVDESKRYRSSDTLLRCSGTFYLAASGLTFTPAVGNRIAYADRSYSVLSVSTYKTNGITVAYRCDVSEAGSA